MDKQLQYTKQQFHVLLERANKRFAKLQTRGDQQWSAAQASFHKTFDAFSRLWQFQLTNRPALLETGLQRSELGCIANKVGQLYYNFYLRSGDTGALLESYTFYDAVHTRQYFAADAPDPSAAARQMRFYARFAVVCLFLNRKEEAMQLLQELQASVSAYQLQFASPDAQEWQLVVNEVTSLLAADVATPLPRCPGSLEVPFRPPRRCRPCDPAATCAPHRPRLREAILVSYRPRQIKVAELPLELYRMAQALEWYDGKLEGGGGPVGQEAAAQAPSTSGSTTQDGGEGSGVARVTAALAGVSLAPTVTAAPASATAQAGGAAGAAAGGSRCRNPPRQLMYKPTVQQLLGSLLSVTGAMTAAAAAPGTDQEFVLLYISADAAAGGGSEAPSASSSRVAAAPRVEAPCRARSSAAAAAAAADNRGPGSLPEEQPLPSCAPRQLLLSPGRVHSQPQPQPHPNPYLHRQSQGYSGGHAAAVSGPAHAPSPLSGSKGNSAQLGGSSGSGCAGVAAQGGGQAGQARGTQSLGSGLAASAAAAAAAPGAVDGWLSVDELLVATRRRLVLVVDSNMSRDFNCLQGREKGPALLCLQSAPQPPPGALTDPARYGCLLTMALACPAQAMCALCGEADPAPATLQRLQEVLDDVLLQLGREMAAQFVVPTAAATATAATETACPAATSAAAAAAAEGSDANGAPDSAGCGAGCSGGGGGGSRQGCPAEGSGEYSAWAPVFDDPLARRLLLHFAFFRCCMSLYSAGSSFALGSRNGSAANGGDGACNAGGDSAGNTSSTVPTCFPPLPPAAAASDEVLRRGVLRAAEVLGHVPLFTAPAQPATVR